MSLLERVIAAHKCRSMHHHIALDALSHLEVEGAEDWKNLMLRHNANLFDGAKAPDSDFKDFKNHVLHVGEGQWGGARDAATEWYAHSVEALRKKNWGRAAYCLGVLSHYFADVCQPFHTGQTEEEGAMHRAVEWSIFKSCDRVKTVIETQGYPEVTLPSGQGFVADMVLAAAEHSHPFYNIFLDHYNLDAGVKEPRDGLDDTMTEAVAACFAYATKGVATLFTTAILEAGVIAPKTHMTVRGYIAAANIPWRKLDKKLDSIADRRTVEKMYKEFQATGKVVKTLPDDDKAIRKLHARVVLRTPLKELDAQPLRPFGTKHTPRTVEQNDELPKIVRSQKHQPAVKENTADAPVEELVVATSAPKVEAKPKRTKAKKKKVAPPPEPLAVEETPKAIEPEVIIEETPVEEIAAEAPASAPEPDPIIEAAPEPEPVPETIIEAAPELTPEPEIIPDPAAPPASDMFEDTDSSRRPRLTLESPVVDAPSIGKKTAKRLAKAGITTIEDLLISDVELAAEMIAARHITPDTLMDWQDQTMLMMDVPGLRTLDVQILVGSGIRSAKDLAKASTADVFASAMNFLGTSEGERVNRFDDEPLAEDKVEGWIDLAREEAA